MQVGLFAKKVGMTQVFDESGTIFPVTILKAGVCKISQIKNTTSDGYNAVQVAYEEKKIDKLNKSIRGHLKKIGDQGFNSFGEFGSSTLPEMFKDGLLDDALKLSFNYMESSIDENLGEGKFAMHKLPIEAQYAPIYGMLLKDLDNPLRKYSK